MAVTFGVVKVGNDHSINLELCYRCCQTVSYRSEVRWIVRLYLVICVTFLTGLLKDRVVSRILPGYLKRVSV